MKRIKSLLFSQKIAPYVFIFPFVLFFALFFIYPIVSTIIMSFQSILPNQVEFVGIKNYARLLKDDLFWLSLKNSLLYMVLTCLFLIPIPMILAFILDSNSVFGKEIFKGIFFLPILASVVVAGTIFRLMFGELPGSFMNQILGLFGIEPQKWLFNFNTSYFALVLLACWRWIGLNTIYFIAGLKNIPVELYEAANMDGANSRQRFIYIVIPMLKPITIFVLTISIYAGLRMFTESYMLWNGNNSPQNIGLTIIGYLYRQGIEQNEMGYASAVGLILLAFALFFNLTQLKISGSLGEEK